MPRHSEETRKALEHEYLEAAAGLVARLGWESASVREIGKAVGKSRGPIHDRFKGSGLKLALIERAYLHPVAAIQWSDEEPASLQDVLRILVEYVRDSNEAAQLMVQVAALATTARHEPGNDELFRAYSRARIGTAKYLENRLGPLLHQSHQRAREMKAEALTDWYLVMCVTLVMHCSTSNPDLVELARGFRALA